VLPRQQAKAVDLHGIALAVFALIITQICWLLESADLKSLPLVLDLDQHGYLPRLFQRGTER
jgi:hypothetical protein